MLVLSIGREQSVRLRGIYVEINGVIVPAGDVTVKVVDVRWEKARLGITAPRCIQIDRLNAEGIQANSERKAVVR